MSGRGTERRVLSEAVLVRLTPALGAAVAACAAEAGLSRAAWLRARAVAAARLAAAECRPSRPAAAPVLPRAEVAEVARLVGAVGKLAGATIQLAKSLRERNAADLHGEAEAVLDELRASQRDLVGLLERLHGAERAP